MTKFNTGSPVGSADPRDLFDTATVADRLVQGENRSYKDRLGKNRKSWTGIEKDFADFLKNSGYELLGDYAAGIEVTAYNQVIRDAGQFWAPAAGTSLPYTTTGAGMDEGGAFVSRGDAVLRQDLADSTPGQGASLVKMQDDATVEEAVTQAKADILDRSIRVSSLPALKALTGVNNYQASLSGTRAGIFKFDSSDLSNEVASDPQGGIYVAPDSDATGASGAWVRQGINYVTPQMFGAAVDGSTDDATAIQAAMDSGFNVYFPKGDYGIGAAINLPLKGFVWGAGRINTRLIPISDVDVMNVQDGTDFLYVAHLYIHDVNVNQTAGKGAIRIRNDLGNINSAFFDFFFIENTYHGIYSQNGTTNGILGVELYQFNVRVRGSACLLHNTTACKLRYFTSDHVGINSSELRDIWLEGNTGAGGGAWMDFVVSQFPNEHGIVVEDFLQIWMRHCTGDNAGQNGIWVLNCGQVHMHQCFASLGGRKLNAGWSMVIENTSLTDSHHTIHQCHAGGANINGGLLVKNIRHCSIEGGTYIENTGDGIKLEGCENIAVNGAISENNTADGIRIEASSYNTINGNTVRANQDGIEEAGASDYNTIVGNVAAFNGAGAADGVITVGANTVTSANIT